jgi:hypothetical protein
MKLIMLCSFFFNLYIVNLMLMLFFSFLIKPFFLTVRKKPFVLLFLFTVNS